MARSDALDALRLAADGWRRREALLTPLQQEARTLLAWLEERPDLEPPLVLAGLDPAVLARPQPAGRRVVLDGAQLFARMPLHAALPRRWLPLAPDHRHLSEQNPVLLLWQDDRAQRLQRCTALALLRHAAAGDAPSLVRILEAKGWPAAAALVTGHADDDSLYVHGSGGVPRELPSPRRMLQAALADDPQALQWLEELAEGGDHWDSGPAAVAVPRELAALPGQRTTVNEWIAKA